MKKSKKIKFCCRCKEKIVGHVFYRYPHVFKKPIGTCEDNVEWCRIMTFCGKCITLFDTHSDNMKAKYMYINNKKLIQFYEQYL